MGMNRMFVHGVGAVSPAGWGAPALRSAVERNEPIPVQSLSRPGWEQALGVRPIPPPPMRPAFLAHPRLRRAGAISQYAIAAALEALGGDVVRVQTGALRLGIVLCVITGSVSYSRRFFEEVLRDPATASPLVFPETVFNAPASHLAAYLSSSGRNYTLVGDSGVYLQGLALAADWLLHDHADGCVVVGAEEMDWILADALNLFQRQAVHSAGAGALYLRSDSSTVSANEPDARGRRGDEAEVVSKTESASSPRRLQFMGAIPDSVSGNSHSGRSRHEEGLMAELACITDSIPFSGNRGRPDAARRIQAQLPGDGPTELLCLGTQNLPRADAAETAAWKDWTGARIAPKATLGEAFTASAAWQCVLACDALARDQFSAANVSVIGANQQAIGARFIRPSL
jgi:hypothetical protein